MTGKSDEYYCFALVCGNNGNNQRKDGALLINTEQLMCTRIAKLGACRHGPLVPGLLSISNETANLGRKDGFLKKRDE